jgi:hypothetical protein
MEVMMQKRSKTGIYGEMVAIALIIIGFLMMVQPFAMILYTLGFSVILSGVILFNVVSHL